MPRSIAMIEEVQAIVGAMLDDSVTDAQMRRLAALLADDSDARRTYGDCIPMEFDLQHLLGDDPQPCERPEAAAESSSEPTEAAQPTVRPK